MVVRRSWSSDCGNLGRTQSVSANYRSEGNPPVEVYSEQNFLVFLPHHQGTTPFIQAQLHNMPALDLILNKNIRLIDYEKITNEKNNRLIAFGKYAGIAGALDFLKGMGEYIMQMGISFPLLSCNCSYKYLQIQEAY